MFNRLSAFFRCREVMAIAETPTGEKVSVSTTDVPEIQEQCSTPIPETACVAENKGESKVAIPMNENRPFEVLEIVDDMRHIRFPDGEEAYVGMELSDDEILIEKSYNDSRDYDAELEEAYNVYLDSMTDEERYDYEHGVTRIQKKREYDEDVGFFSSVCIQDVHKNPDGSTLIEETEQEVYVTPDGSVYYLEDMGPICDFYEKHKDNIESHEEIMTRKQRCDEAFNELKRHEELYNRVKPKARCMNFEKSVKFV
uniref:hypothetical protein n=1 Tax=Duncaniella muris TaxID=2094150 RepID=UPI002736DEE4